MRCTTFSLLLLFGLTLTAAGVEGSYSGDWSGGAAAGELRLTLTRSGEEWKCEAVFTLGGQEVPTTQRRVSVDGDKVEIEYDFDLQGNKLTSTLTGQLDGQTLSGKYQTKDSGGGAVDEGSWKVTRK
jgi:hypothetical protein